MLITQTVEKKISTHESEKAGINNLIVMTFNAEDVMTYFKHLVHARAGAGDYDIFFLLKEDFVGSMFDESNTEILAVHFDIETSEEIKNLDEMEKEEFFDYLLEEVKKESNNNSYQQRYKLSFGGESKCDIVRISLIGMVEFFLHKEGIDLTDKHRLANQVLKSLHSKKLLTERIETLLESIFEDSEDYEVFDKPYINVVTLLEETESLKTLLHEVVFKPEGALQ